MVPCSQRFEHGANESHVCGWICVCKVEQGMAAVLLCAVGGPDCTVCVCVCVMIGWAMKGGGLFLSLEVIFFARLLCMVVLNARHSCTHTSVPSCRVSVRLVLLVVVGITSQGLHSLTEETQLGWFACRNHLWVPVGLSASSFLIYLPLLLHMLVELIFWRQSCRLLILFASS